MTDDPKPARIEIPPTGVHVLPLVARPNLLWSSEKPQFLVVELVPVYAGVPSASACRIPMHIDDAMELATMILHQAQANGWQPPPGAPRIHRVQ